MTQSRFGGRGKNAGRNGHGAANGQGNGHGLGAGYTSKPKTAKVGLCKELESNIFDYRVSNATDLMRTTQEKIAQYVGIKYGEDIANELTNKTTVTVAPPVYSLAILLRHQEWENVRKKQKNVKTALNAKLIQLKAAATVDQDVVANADTKNLIDDVKYQQGQEVPSNLTASERLDYNNESKSHSYHVAMLEKHCGNVYVLIYRQCTQILQGKMKQDKNWSIVSVSYKPLELCKLIKRVILKQTKEQYPVAALREQLCNVTNPKQGNMTNN
jgi:hypothetical protein